MIICSGQAIEAGGFWLHICQRSAYRVTFSLTRVYRNLCAVSWADGPQITAKGGKRKYRTTERHPSVWVGPIWCPSGNEIRARLSFQFSPAMAGLHVPGKQEVARRRTSSMSHKKPRSLRPKLQKRAISGCITRIFFLLQTAISSIDACHGQI